MRTDRSRKLLLIAAVVAGVCVLGIGVLREAGYVVSRGYLVAGGELAIAGAVPGSAVFVDNRRVGRTEASGSTRFTGIGLGERTVIVAHTAYWPWTRTYTSASGETTELLPLQVPREPDVQPLSDATAILQQRATEAFAAYRQPAQIAPLEREGMRVWVQGTTVFAQQGGAVHTLFTSPHSVRSVLWFGNRSDAVVIASEQQVFVVDMPVAGAASDSQNFFPLYTGTAPEAVADPIRSDVLFVRDGGEYVMLTL